MKITKEDVNKILKDPIVINIATEIDLYMVHKKLNLVLDINHRVYYTVQDLIKQKTYLFNNENLDAAIEKYNEIGE